ARTVRSSPLDRTQARIGGEALLTDRSTERLPFAIVARGDREPFIVRAAVGLVRHVILECVAIAERLRPAAGRGEVDERRSEKIRSHLELRKLDRLAATGTPSRLERGEHRYGPGQAGDVIREREAEADVVPPRRIGQVSEPGQRVDGRRIGDEVAP